MLDKTYTHLNIEELQNLVNEFAKALGPINVSPLEFSAIDSFFISDIIKKIEFDAARVQ